MEAGGWTSSQAAQRYIHLHDAVMKEAAERLSSIKPTGTVTRTGADTPSTVNTAAQIVETTRGLASLNRQSSSFVNYRLL